MKKKKLLFPLILCFVFSFHKSVGQTFSLPGANSNDTVKSTFYIQKAKTFQNTDSVLHYLNMAKELVLKNIATESGEAEINTIYLNKTAKLCRQIGSILSRNKRTKEAENSLLKAMKYYERTGNKEGISDVYFFLGLNYVEKNDPGKALAMYEKALELKEQLKIDYGVAATMSNISILYSNSAEIQKAIEYAEKALSINKKIANWKGVAANLNSLALIYRSQGHKKEALTFFEKILHMKELGNEEKLSAHINSGVMLYELGDFHAALENLDKAMKALESGPDKESLAATLHNIGMVHAAQHNSPLAHKYFTSALKNYEEINDAFGVATACNSLADIYSTTGDNKTAKKYLLKGFESAKRSGRLEAKFQIAQHLSGIYEELKDHKNALEMYEYYRLVKDSLVNSDNKTNSMRSALKYEFEKKEIQAKVVMEKKNAVARAESEERKKIIFGTVIAFCLLLVFFVYVIYTLRIANKQKSLIEKKKLETDQQKLAIEIRNKEIIDSITYAKRIQLSLIPSDKKMETLFLKFKFQKSK